MTAVGIVVVLATLAALPTAARAENPRINTQTFRPSPHAYDIFATATSDVAAPLGWAAAMWLSYGMDPLIFVDALGQSPDDEAITDQLSLHLTGSVAPLKWLSVGLEVPVFVVNDGTEGGFVGLDPIASTGLGDIRLSAELGIVQRHAKEDGIGFGAEVSLGLPTGDASSFVSDGWSLVPTLVVDARLGIFQIAGNIGARFRDTAILPLSTEVGHELVFRVAARLEVIADVCEVMAELVGSSHDFAEGNNTYLEGLVGGRLNFGASGFHATLGIGRGLAEGYGSTALRVVGQFGWAPPLPRRPALPPPADKDGDTIVDDIDKCPDDPEDKDGFEDDDGCPDRDDDGDGVTDTIDRCRLEPEDQDGFEDGDGCPDGDNDRDEIADANDGETGACKDLPEDKDGFQDTDGCPDPDNDGDGILDPDDDCPNDPTNRCGITVNQCEIVISQTILFEYDKDVIRPDSYAIIDAVAAVLATHPEVKLVEVQGHTDSEGHPDYNLRLSQRRAEAVMRYLVERRAIEPARLKAKGFGKAQPIASNRTPDGAAKNRRVQFVILDPAQTDCPR